MIAQVRASIVAGWVLAKRNISIQVRDHALGYGWVFLVPALYALGFVYIKREFMADATPLRDNTSWEVMRAFCGIMLVQFWLLLVQDMADIVGRNRSLMRGLNIGPIPFVLSVAFEGLVNLGIRMSLVFLALAALGHGFPSHLSSWTWIGFSVLILQLTAYAVGLFLAPWSALYPDMRKALQSMALPLILVTPIFYAPVADPQRALYWLAIVNPLAAPIAVMSNGLQGISAIPYSFSLSAWGLLSFAVIVWSVVQLRWQIPVLLERIGD